MTRLLEEKQGHDFKDAIKEIYIDIREFSKMFLTAIKQTFSNENMLDNTIRKIDGMLIHNELVNILHKKGLNPNWIKMIVDQNDCCVWLRNIDDMYVLLSEELLQMMEFDKGFNPLGKTSMELSHNSNNKHMKKQLAKCHISDLEVKRVGTSVMSDNDRIIVKYGIKNKDDILVAIFGIIIERKEDSDELIFKDKRFLEHFQEAIATNDFSLDG
jgi:hypothetical protein